MKRSERSWYLSFIIETNTIKNYQKFTDFILDITDNHKLSKRLLKNWRDYFVTSLEILTAYYTVLESNEFWNVHIAWYNEYKRKAIIYFGINFRL